MGGVPAGHKIGAHDPLRARYPSGAGLRFDASRRQVTQTFSRADGNGQTSA
ncbi:MAG: hypothetical protein ABSH49_31390 [Bryobacteraceae bacterium]